MLRMTLSFPQAAATTVLAIAVVVGGAFARGGQNDDLKRQVEAHQREVKQRIEKGRREMEQMRREMEAKVGRPRTTGSPPRSPSAHTLPAPHPANLGSGKANASAAPRSIAKAPELRACYDLRDGTLLAYQFRLETQADEDRRLLAGIAIFEIDAKTSGSVHVLARDNLQFASALAAAPSLPVGSEMIRATFSLESDGLSPVIEGELPELLGRPQDWFFPPLPQTVDQPKASGYTVQRGTWLSQVPEWDKQNRGFFEWEVKVVRSTASRLELADRRSFRTDDRAQEFEGTGQISFDRGGKSGGRMVSRAFRGTCSLYGKKTQVSLSVQQLSVEQLRGLVRD